MKGKKERQEGTKKERTPAVVRSKDKQERV
jgi:hypothetical protein